MLFGGVNMAPAPPHHRRLLLLPPLLLLLCAVSPVSSRSSQISDLKSKISGVEELLEEFRKQLQQDQAYQAREAEGGGDAADSCLSGFSAAGERIIRARASIEQGATFLSAPAGVLSWTDCLHACCAEPRCTVAVVPDDLGRTDEALSCYLFNCTYKNKNVCSFAPQQGFSTYSRTANTSLDLAPGGQSLGDNTLQEVDEPPRSDAGQDVVIRLPTDWAVLDGRDSVDDHGISRYEWALLGGESAINMKVTHPGLLKVSGLQQGVYTFQMIVTDTAGQKSSDNVSVTVLAPEHHAHVCTGQCSRYQFMCDDGCCIDITYACDGKQQCPDRSDEAFCRNFDSNRKSVTHPAGDPGQQRPADEQTAAESVVPPQVPPQHQDRTMVPPPPPAHPKTASRQEAADSQDPCAAPPFVGPCKGTFPRWYYDQEAAVCKHFLYGGCQGNHNNFLQEADCVNECVQKSPAFKPATVAPPTTKQAATAVLQGQPERDLPISKPYPVLGGHPGPESGAILPLALGLIITALLLMMISCRLRLVRHKLKKTRPLTTEESDYLINGMYL